MKILYVDIDGVLANFKLGVANSGLEKQYKGRPDKIPGVYKNLPLIEDAKNSIGKLFNSGLYDIYFLSSAPWDNPNAWTDKRLWVEKHFGLKTRKRLILSHRKIIFVICILNQYLTHYYSEVHKVPNKLPQVF